MLDHEIPPMRVLKRSLEPSGIGALCNDLPSVVETDLDLAQQCAQPRQGVRAIGALGNDFCNHRVIVTPDFVALLQAAVDACAVLAEAEGAGGRRDAPPPDCAAVWNELMIGPFRIQPSLNGMTLPAPQALIAKQRAAAHGFRGERHIDKPELRQPTMQLAGKQSRCP